MTLTPTSQSPDRSLHRAGAKLGANTYSSRASSGAVRRLSSQLSTVSGGVERRLAWFGFAS